MPCHNCWSPFMLCFNWKHSWILGYSTRISLNYSFLTLFYKGLKDQSQDSQDASNEHGHIWSVGSCISRTQNFRSCPLGIGGWNEGHKDEDKEESKSNELVHCVWCCVICFVKSKELWWMGFLFTHCITLQQVVKMMQIILIPSLPKMANRNNIWNCKTICNVFQTC